MHLSLRVNLTMEATTFYHSSSSSSSSSNISFPSQHDKTKRTKRNQSSFHASLKSSQKPKIMKMPIAPFPRVPPKIHFVEPQDFKDVVHRLTTSPEYQLRNHLEVAPPSANNILMQTPHETTLIVLDNDDDDDTDDEPQRNASFQDDFINLEMLEDEITENFTDSLFGPLSPLAFQSSPYNSQTWFPSVLWSPGTMYSVEQEVLF